MEDRDGNYYSTARKREPLCIIFAVFELKKKFPMNRSAPCHRFTSFESIGNTAGPCATKAPVHSADRARSLFQCVVGTDNLTDSETKHWTGASQPISGLIRVDGNTFRFMGREAQGVPAMQQVSKLLTPTRTIYEFEKAGIHLTLTFFTPALAADLAILSRPVTYLSWDVRSVDSGSHAVSIYLDCSSLLAVNTANESVVWSRVKVGNTELLSVGSSEQRVLGASGDDLRINWGHFYLAAPDSSSERLAAVDAREARRRFSTGGGLSDADLLDMPATPRSGAAVLASLIDFGNVGTATVSRHVLVAYDDQFSIEYLNRKLRPYWRKDRGQLRGPAAKSCGRI